MKLLMLFCLTLSAYAQDTTARVTFFREDQSMMKQMGQFKTDFVPAGFKWNVYMDGSRLVTLRRGRYITFTVAAGHHDFKTDTTERLSLDVPAGSSVFLRPAMRRTDSKLEGKVTLEAINCSDYIERTGKIKPVKFTDVFTGTVAPSGSFSCDAGKRP
jgi:hypothetical protein